ncbi:hypothetical protein BGZ65_006401 [Modicella reniformis]|uniref:Uncharacterized protein n=1 Tax=Modicella reniformis TaxID=1440133 RepID=A0A9P6M2G4_9FUNG|nr:hypothetical protein BGZ65_006401 [Modicella reniformis]
METLQNRARMDLISSIQKMTEVRELSLLELHIESLDDFQRFLWPVLQNTTMLTSLRLKKCHRLEELYVDCDVHLSRPRLIIVLYPEPSNNDLDYNYNGHNLNPKAGQLQKNILPKGIRLKRLHLRDVLFQKSTLRAILDAASDLHELMIQTPAILQPLTTHPAPTNIGGGTSSTDIEYSGEDWVSCDKLEFFQDIGMQYQQLTSLHFTRAHHRYTEAQIRTILASFPKASRWSLVWRDLPDGILRDLNSCVGYNPHALQGMSMNASPRAYSNHLTSLEIVPSADWTPRWGSALHEFLCSSPLLEHLRAGSIAYYVENLDLNGLLPKQDDCYTLIEDEDDDVDNDQVGLCDFARNDLSKNTPSNTDAIPRKVWACRKLKTLHLEFTRRRHLQHYNALRSAYTTTASSNSSSTSHSARTSSRSPTIILENSPRLSRIVYGYIARFCPRLQDLLIRGYRLNMTLQGGFCLLTRLRELRKVAISQYDCQFKEKDILPWIVKRRSSITAAQRLQWSTMYAGWWKLTHAKELRVSVTPHPVVNNADVDGVEKLGELTDVIDVLKEIAAPSMSSSPSQGGQVSIWADQTDHIWPNLECIRIVYGNRIKPKTKDVFLKTLLQKYRPEAELQWISWLEQYF